MDVFVVAGVPVDPTFRLVVMLPTATPPPAVTSEVTVASVSLLDVTLNNPFVCTIAELPMSTFEV